MQQVALDAIDAYVGQTAPPPRESVPVAELLELFADLPPMNAAAFRAEQDRAVDDSASFDAYERARRPEASA